MTREEAIEILSEYQHIHRKETDGVEALRMAIEDMEDMEYLSVPDGEKNYVVTRKINMRNKPNDLRILKYVMNKVRKWVYRDWRLNENFVILTISDLLAEGLIDRNDEHAREDVTFALLSVKYEYEQRCEEDSDLFWGDASGMDMGTMCSAIYHLSDYESLKDFIRDEYPCSPGVWDIILEQMISKDVTERIERGKSGFLVVRLNERFNWNFLLGGEWE